VRVLATPPPPVPHLAHVVVDNGSTPFLGDGKWLTTVSPNGDGFRDEAYVHFTLSAPARVSLDVVETSTEKGDPERPSLRVIKRFEPRTFPAGFGTIVWRPGPTTAPRTYQLRLHVFRGTVPGRSPVVRVQGIDAGFFKPSYAPGDDAVLKVATDAKVLTFQVFAYSGGRFPTIRDLRTK